MIRNSLILMFFMLSCTEAINISGGFVEDTELDLVDVDTLTLQLNTFKFDSIQTGNGDRHLVGAIKIDSLTATFAEFYCQLTPDIYSTPQNANTKYNDARLVIYYDSYSYGDTTTTFQLEVFRLIEPMEYREDGYLYNTSSFDYDYSQSIAQRSFIPFPNKLDSVEIPFSDELGMELYEMILADDERITDSEEFLEYFNGLVFKTDTSITKSIIGLDPNIKLRIYYTDYDEDIATEKFFSFSVSGERDKEKYLYYFNHIQSINQNGVFDDQLSQSNMLSSESTDHKVMLQGGTGIGVRMDLPYVKQLLNFQEELVLYKVTIDIRPLVYDQLFPYPKNISTIQLTEDNGYVKNYYDNITLVEDSYFDRDTRYIIDITEYVKEEMYAYDENDQRGLGLIMNLDYMASEVSCLLFNDTQTSQYLKPKFQFIQVK